MENFKYSFLNFILDSIFKICSVLFGLLYKTTSIGDVIKFVKKVLDIQSKLPNTEIMNICSNRPINILKIIELMKKNKINPKEKKISFQRADVLKTHGDNSKIKKFTKIKRYLDWKIGVQNTINWWKLHYKIK